MKIFFVPKVPKCIQCGYPLALSLAFLDFAGSKVKTVTCSVCGVENVR